MQNGRVPGGCVVGQVRKFVNKIMLNFGLNGTEEVQGAVSDGFTLEVHAACSRKVTCLCFRLKKTHWELCKVEVEGLEGLPRILTWRMMTLEMLCLGLYPIVTSVLKTEYRDGL
jgi:hypothetical protein